MNDKVFRGLLLQQDGDEGQGIITDWWPGALLVLLLACGWAVWRRRRRSAERSGNSREHGGKDPQRSTRVRKEVP